MIFVRIHKNKSQITQNDIHTQSLTHTHTHTHKQCAEYIGATVLSIIIVTAGHLQTLGDGKLHIHVASLNVERWYHAETEAEQSFLWTARNYARSLVLG